MTVQPKIRTGVGVIWTATRKICVVAERFGTVAHLNAINPALSLAIAAVIEACHAIRNLDDFPFEIDSSGVGVGEVPDGGGDSSGPF